MSESPGQLEEAKPRRFRPYGEYRDSGVEWLGEIPAHWECRRLKFVAAGPIKNGIGEAGTHDDPEWPRYVRITDIAGPRKLRDDTFKSLPPELAKQAAFEVGDLLLAAVGATFGKSYLHVHDVGPACFAGYLVRFSPGPEVDPSYAAYWTESSSYWALVESRVVQATIQNFSAARYKELSLPLPSLAEQHAIAAFLDRETARIDGLVARKERLIELLQEKRTALITSAVTKGLDPDVPMKDCGVEWMGETPEHWEVKKVTWLFAIGSGTTPRSQDLAYYGGEMPWVTTSELRESVISATDKCVTEEALRDYSSLKVHPAGSVIVAMYGATIGRLGILGVAATVNQACCVFSQPTGITNRFWFYWLQMRRPQLIALGYGGGQPNLSQELLRSIRIPLPPVAEQEEIVRSLDRQTARIEGLVGKIQKAIERLDEFRTALISAAVTGKIDVREEAA